MHDPQGHVEHDVGEPRRRLSATFAQSLDLTWIKQALPLSRWNGYCTREQPADRIVWLVLAMVLLPSSSIQVDSRPRDLAAPPVALTPARARSPVRAPSPRRG